MKATYEKWSKARRFKAAVGRVLDDEWSQTAAAKEFGVSRQHLNKKVSAERLRRSEKSDEVKRQLAAGELYVPVRDVKYDMSFAEFDQRYFGHWICPDCHKHHETPDFHREISEAVRGDARRVLINLPPYHSKSTNVTIKDTIYDLAMDPNSRTIIVSKSTPFARTFVHAIEELLSVPERYEGAAGNLIEEFGPFKPEGQAIWSASQFYVAKRSSPEKDPSVLAIGVSSQIYGRRADKIKFDDVATLSNQRNPEMVANMMEWIDKEALSRIGWNGKAIWAGTRVHPGDIYKILGARDGYQVLRYPALKDEDTHEVLWGDHFPYEQVMMHREEMTPADFQLVYQNVDMPGLGASFTQELVDQSKDVERAIGQYDPRWRFVAGLDPAGGNKKSGYTAFSLIGVDLATGQRFLVDQEAHKSMKAPQLKDLMLEWSDRYPIYEWRVESNGVQSQIVQYNEEIVRALALKGIKVTPHFTHANKWDPQFGVESLAPLMASGLISIPWGNRETQKRLAPFEQELLSFPMGTLSDRVMSFWFADLGVRELLKRAHLPMFNQRMHVPARIKRRRRVISFADRSVRGIPLSEQRAGHILGDGRMAVGTPGPWADVQEIEPETPPIPVNVDPKIWNPDPV